MFPRQESPPRDPGSGRTAGSAREDDDTLSDAQRASASASQPGAALRAYAPRARTPFTPLRTGVPAPPTVRPPARRGWDEHATLAGAIGVALACASVGAMVGWALLG